MAARYDCTLVLVFLVWDLLLCLHVGHAKMIFNCLVWKSKSGMLKLPWNVACKDLKFFFWMWLFCFSYPNLKSVHELIYKRGYGKINKQRIALTDNRLIQKRLGNFCWANGEPAACLVPRGDQCSAGQLSSVSLQCTGVQLWSLLLS